MNIISHRGYLDGRGDSNENGITLLTAAIGQGFEVEFDVNLAAGKACLVLSHDKAEWSLDRDAATFLRACKGKARHALNIKNLLVLYPVVEILRLEDMKDKFVLFDFELLWPDHSEIRYLMRELTESGYHVAYRLSEREQYLDRYLLDESVKTIWLDEFEHFWVRREHVERLAAKGIRTLFVSPELHGTTDETVIRKRWSDVIQYGVDGICTDYPLKLRDFAGGHHD